MPETKQQIVLVCPAGPGFSFVRPEATRPYSRAMVTVSQSALTYLQDAYRTLAEIEHEMRTVRGIIHHAGGRWSQSPAVGWLSEEDLSTLIPETAQNALDGQSYASHMRQGRAFATLANRPGLAGVRPLRLEEPELVVSSAGFVWQAFLPEDRGQVVTFPVAISVIHCIGDAMKRFEEQAEKASQEGRPVLRVV